MRDTLRFVITLLTAALLLGASYVQAAEENTALKPALWQIEHQGQVSYLFGSIHIGKASWYPLPKSVTQAYESSDSLVVELNTLIHGNEVQEAMALPIGKTLKQELAATTYQKLQQYVTSYGVPMAAFEQLKPWAAATVAAILPYMSQGLMPQHGIDMHFITDATRKAKRIVELESVEFQLGMLEKLFGDETAFVELLDMPLSDAKALVDYWFVGDMEGLDRITSAQMSPEQMELLLRKRNHAWMIKLKQLLSGSQSHFIVVGAAHLAGKDGVPALLSAQGYKLKRIN